MAAPDRLYVPSGPLRAQAEGIPDGRVLLRRQTTQVEGQSLTTEEGDDEGHVVARMSLVEKEEPTVPQGPPGVRMPRHRGALGNGGAPS